MATSTGTGTSGRAIPLVPIVALIAVFLFALDSLYGQIFRNGYLDEVRSLLDAEAAFLPGSINLIVKRYTGIAALDRPLALLNIFFANVTDGSRPELSFFAFYFAGQLVPIFLVLMVEGLRVAKGSGILLNPVIWGLFMQCFGFGAVMPIYAITHLIFTSRFGLSTIVRLKDPIKLHTVIPAFFFGYFLLTGLLVFPFPQTDIRQKCNVIWQGFPLHVVGYTALFSGMMKSLSLGQHASISEVRLNKEALNYAYWFAWSIAVVTQVSTYVIIFVAPSFPGLFPAGVADSLTFLNAFLPGSFHSNEPMISMAAAIHDFFVYDLYAGSFAAIVWAVSLLAQVSDVSAPGQVRQLIRGIAISVQLAGPGGALVALLQQRDEIVLTYEEKVKKSQ